MESYIAHCYLALMKVISLDELIKLNSFVAFILRHQIIKYLIKSD